MKTFYEFKFTREEMDYLRKITSQNENLALLLARQRDVSSKGIIMLNRAEAESIRDFLTIQLAKAGFDENYIPTIDGRTLEDLIDRFYIQKST